MHDLLFHLNNADSFKIIENKINKTNFLICTGLRHSVPKHLKESNVQSTSLCSFIIEDNVFDLTKKKEKSKHFYSLLLKKRRNSLIWPESCKMNLISRVLSYNKCLICLIK